MSEWGLGVLVESCYILTVAHCINVNCTVDTVISDYFVEEIHTKEYWKLKVGLNAIESLSDIAA